MSSVSTWSLLLNKILLFAHQEEVVLGGGVMIFDGPVPKGALDHVTHWTSPAGIVFGP